MSLFRRWRSVSIENGVEGRAKIRVSEPSGEPGLRENSGDSIFELELNRFGTRAYRLVLDVELEGEPPFEVDGTFHVPRRAENTGLLAGSVGNSLKPGLELPVVVDPRDRTRVEVDWKKFLAAPERKAAQKQTEQDAYDRALAKTHNKAAVKAWAEMVQAGELSRETFERNVAAEIEGGRMDPADAEKARAKL